MTIARYNSEPERTVSSIFDRFFNEIASENRYYKFLPDVDFVETEKSYEIHAAIPGLKKSDFDIEVTNGLLVISGERKFLNEDKTKTYHSIQTKFGKFSRSFQLPENANFNKITASYNDGILQVNVPKDEAKLIKAKIEVN
jgi:HSP20 family protein